MLIYHVSQKPFFTRKRTMIQIVAMVLALVIIIGLSLQLGKSYLLLLAILGIVSILYNSLINFNIPFLPLRGIPLLKVFLIAFVWAGIGVFLPFLDTPGYEMSKLVVFYLSQFLFIVAITLPFDIRDFYGDYRKNLVTFPSVVGIQATKVLSYLCLFIHSLGMLYINFRLIYLYIPVLITAFFLVKRSSASRPNYYYLIFVDGLIILQFLSFYISHEFLM